MRHFNAMQALAVKARTCSHVKWEFSGAPPLQNSKWNGCIKYTKWELSHPCVFNATISIGN